MGRGSSSWSSSSRADYIFSLFPAAFATREWRRAGGREGGGGVLVGVRVREWNIFLIPAAFAAREGMREGVGE